MRYLARQASGMAQSREVPFTQTRTLSSIKALEAASSSADATKAFVREARAQFRQVQCQILSEVGGLCKT